MDEYNIIIDTNFDMCCNMRFVLFHFSDLVDEGGVQAEGERTNKPSPMQNSGKDYYKNQACGLWVDMNVYWPTLIPNPIKDEGKSCKSYKVWEQVCENL